MIYCDESKWVLILSFLGGVLQQPFGVLTALHSVPQEAWLRAGRTAYALGI